MYLISNRSVDFSRGQNEYGSDVSFGDNVFMLPEI